MPSEKTARVEHGETYQHVDYGEVEVKELTAPIAAMGEDGPERNYFVRFSTEIGAEAVPGTKIYTERYSKFAEALE